MHDICSSAMRVGGNDHLVEYNEIYNAVTESDDQGGVDMFGNPTFRGNVLRGPQLGLQPEPRANSTAQSPHGPRVVHPADLAVYRYNYLHHIGNWRGNGEQPKCGQAGIRLDDAICGTRIYGNIFERCSAGKLGFGGVQIHGGKDNVVENNLFIECSAMVSCSPWDEKRWREYVGKALDSREIDRALYVQRYPELADLAEHANRNHILRNMGWRCGELLRRAPPNLDVKDNTMLGNKEFTWQLKSFRLNRPGFDPIPFEEIGLYRDNPFRPL